MKQIEIKRAIKGYFYEVLGEIKERGTEFEDVRNWFGHKCNVFQYGATCERQMERNLEQICRERKTTFMSDLSIGEWYGVAGLLDTTINCVSHWYKNREYIAEFLMAFNFKSWEHNARENHTWAYLYGELYYKLRDLILDELVEKEEDKSYIYNFLD